MKNTARVRLVVVPALLTWASFAVPPEQPAVRATMKPVQERKPSLQFALKDTTGLMLSRAHDNAAYAEQRFIRSSDTPIWTESPTARVSSS